MFSQDPRRRYGASLGALSAGRVGIAGMGTTNMKLAICIALRYYQYNEHDWYVHLIFKSHGAFDFNVLLFDLHVHVHAHNVLCYVDMLL